MLTQHFQRPIDYWEGLKAIKTSDFNLGRS